METGDRGQTGNDQIPGKFVFDAVKAYLVKKFTGDLCRTNWGSTRIMPIQGVKPGWEDGLLSKVRLS